jgi:alcohol dehydrogenase
MVAHALGARVIAVDLTAEKLALATTSGAEHTINANSCRDVPAAIHDLTGGGAHASFDALGSVVTATNSINCLRPRGRHVQIGLMAGSAARAAVPFDRIVARELELFGSHGMQAHRYPALFAMIADGRLDPGLLVARTATLAEALPALTSESALTHPGIMVIDRI